MAYSEKFLQGALVDARMRLQLIGRPKLPEMGIEETRKFAAAHFKQFPDPGVVMASLKGVLAREGSVPAGSPDDPSCSRCRFWSALMESFGECRISPPRMNAERNGEWPRTGRDDWCGAFSAKRVDVNDKIAARARRTR